MRLADYFELLEAPGLDGAAADVLSAYLEQVLAEEVLHTLPQLVSARERSGLDEILAGPALARRGAPLTVRDGPILLAHPGLGGAHADNFVLYEYLASRGWVVVAGVFQQATGERTGVEWDPRTSIRDLEVLRREVPARLELAPSAFAVLGHSYGAQVALVYTTLPGRADAVVSLDSTLENAAGPSSWWKDEDVAPWLDRAEDIRVPALLFANPGASRTFFDAMAARRELVLVEGLAHNDFEGLGGVLRPLLEACVSPDACARLHRRHLGVVALIGEFLATVDARSSALATSVDDDELADLGFARSFAHAPSTPPTSAKALPPLDTAPTDCRTDDSCDPVDVAVERSEQLLAVGRSAEALVDLDRARARFPDRWEIHGARGRVLAALGRYVEAAEAFEAEADFFDRIERGPPVVQALAERARERAGRAAALANHSDIDPRNALPSTQ